MVRLLIAYVLAALVFGALDAAWLSWAGPNLYQPIIGELMADSINLSAAAAFYFIYLAGMVWFAVRPGLESANALRALLNGALLGALCYATFDLTSQAVFKVWSTTITLLDIAWGAFATGTTSAVVTAITLRVAKS
ncbi:MAG: DUF2177 family protein [Pseudomonadota bacterium]